MLLPHRADDSAVAGGVIACRSLRLPAPDTSACDAVVFRTWCREDLHQEVRLALQPAACLLAYSQRMLFGDNFSPAQPSLAQKLTW